MCSNIELATKMDALSSALTDHKTDLTAHRRELEQVRRELHGIDLANARTDQDFQTWKKTKCEAHDEAIAALQRYERETTKTANKAATRAAFLSTLVVLALQLIFSLVSGKGLI